MSVQPRPKRAPRPSVSKTSISIFDDCQHKYALMYLWWKLPPQLQRAIAYQGKLMPYEAFAGQVVDDVITDTLRNFSDRGWEVPYKERAKEILREYIVTSGQWLESYHAGIPPPEVHRQPLNRYFFREPLTEDEKARIRENIETCLDNFWNSKIPKLISDHAPEHWKVPPSGETPWFMSGDVPVWAKYDFAIVTPEKADIFDWKTGKVSKRAEGAAREQLHTYAAFAMEEWSVPAERLTLHAVWLSAGVDQISSEPVSVDYLDEIRAKWVERHALLKNKLKILDSEPESMLELFPMTGIETGRCKYCQFRACDGYRKYVLEAREAM